jgi:HSP20 family molecular chaperone IbpA
MLPEASAPAQVMETGDEYRIAVPIGDIDLCDICVLAQPRSILIENRAPESAVQHAPDAIYSEGNTERALRQLHLEHPIHRGGTALRIVGDSLQIISKKAEAAEEESWSESIDFDTRGSLGCV